MKVFDCIERLMSIQKVSVGGVISTGWRDRETLTAMHVRNAGLRSNEVLPFWVSQSHRELLNIANGMRILDGKAMGSATDSCAVAIFSIDEIDKKSAEYLSYLKKGLDLAVSGGYITGDVAAASNGFLCSLRVCGFVGDSGSVLVVHANSNADRVYLLTSEMAAMPIVDVEDMETYWESFSELLCWVASDVCEAVADKWTYVFQNGDQGTLIGVEYADHFPQSSNS